jgi:hypothetical protein
MNIALCIYSIDTMTGTEKVMKNLIQFLQTHVGGLNIACFFSFSILSFYKYEFRRGRKYWEGGTYFGTTNFGKFIETNFVLCPDEKER